MASHTHQQATGISPERFLSSSELDDFVARTADQDSALVLLDDFSGSGDSLKSHIRALRSSGYTGKIVVVPSVATTAAELVFKALDDAGVYFRPSVVIPTFDGFPMFLSAVDNERAAIRSILGSLGFRGSSVAKQGPGVMVAFPYMSPNNNNEFMYRNLAPEFTYRGAGAKPPMGVSPPRTPSHRIDDIAGPDAGERMGSIYPE